MTLLLVLVSSFNPTKLDIFEGRCATKFKNKTKIKKRFDYKIDNTYIVY